MDVVDVADLEVGELEKMPRTDLDGAWKEVLRKYFKEFVELCWPEILDKIDWKKQSIFLEKEFQAILKKEEIGERIADKLIQVWLKDGREVWALVHLEIQGDRGKEDFSERIYIYRYRIFDIYRKDIATLAILIDSNRKWRPNVYQREFWGTKLRLEYPILKILDFQKEKGALLKSRNPFALVILAQLAALETAGDNPKRMVTKFGLTKSLYLQGWNKSDVLDLLRFLEQILVLPKDLTLQYHHQVAKLEKELDMAYMTYVEKMWLEQGESTLLLQQLKSKFKTIPDFYRQKIAKANSETLLIWGIRVLDSRTIEEVFEQDKTSD